MVQLPKSVKDSLLKKKPTTPLWTGPNGAGPNGGITNSLLQRFLLCRARFFAQVIEGLRAHDTFSHRLEFGNMFHICEEAYLKGKDPTNRKLNQWEAPLAAYCKELCKKYPLQQEHIMDWGNVCKTQFSHYLNYWSKHKETTRKPIVQEQVFDIPYELPSGRTVRLRGKFDNVGLSTTKNPSLYLGEHKTKGEINENEITRNLLFDLQTGLYLVALNQDTGIEAIEEVKGWDGKRFRVPVAGVTYNVVRRPLSGGKHSISRHKERVYANGRRKPEETKEAFYKRLGSLIEKEPEYFFMRWNVNVLPDDIENFKRKMLIPVLENLCDWYEWIEGCIERRGMEGYTDDPFYSSSKGIHWQTPFGCWGIELSDEYNEYLTSGSTIGLAYTKNLFPELQTLEE